MGRHHSPPATGSAPDKQRLDASAETSQGTQIESCRRGWRTRLKELAKQAGALPARPDDLDVAVAGMGDPGAGDADLLEALREVVIARLSGYGAPDAALAAAQEDLPKGPSGAPTLEMVRNGAMLVAETFALPGPKAIAYADRAVEAERLRRGERRTAGRLARGIRVEEERRLRAWEASLVGTDALPGLLGCSWGEAERWVRAGRVPVAR